MVRSLLKNLAAANKSQVLQRMENHVITLQGHAGARVRPLALNDKAGSEHPPAGAKALREEDSRHDACDNGGAASPPLVLRHSRMCLKYYASPTEPTVVISFSHAIVRRGLEIALVNDGDMLTIYVQMNSENRFAQEYTPHWVVPELGHVEPATVLALPSDFDAMDVDQGVTDACGLE